jgi:hypothetical protein
LLAGGWNNMALTDTAAFSKDNFRWTFYNGSGTTPGPLSVPLRDRFYESPFRLKTKISTLKQQIYIYLGIVDNNL